MTIPVSLETDKEGNCIAFAFDFPGACGWGSSEQAALTRLSEDIEWTTDWLHRHNSEAMFAKADSFSVTEKIDSTGYPLRADRSTFACHHCSSTIFYGKVRLDKNMASCK